MPRAYESIAIVGPTASGKTARAVGLARLLEGEILSADSRQVYKKMDIGTGKDLNEYENVPYHLIDIAEPGEKYNLYRYLKDFNESYSGVLSKGKIPVICGGSGMYVETALSGIKLPEVPVNERLRKELEGKTLEELTLMLSNMKSLHNSTDVDTVKRAVRAIEIETFYLNNPDLSRNVVRNPADYLNCLIIGVDIPREQRRMKISQRLSHRLKEGMIDEVKSLLDSGIPSETLIYYGLEYKFLTLYLLGELSYEEMKKSLEIAIHQFAKRQMTWFRGMEKRGMKINWLSYDLAPEEFNKAVLNLTLSIGNP